MEVSILYVGSGEDGEKMCAFAVWHFDVVRMYEIIGMKR
jgi:hypothetical protein